MALIQPSTPAPKQSIALLNLGFRTFFLAGGLFAVIVMLMWGHLYFHGSSTLPERLGGVTWHAHEMLFGYALAVIAGFLLTAVQNWTNIQTLHGWPLLLLTLIWAAARVLPFSGLDSALWLMAGFDLVFLVGLLVALSVPVVRVRQWPQLAVLGKLALLLVANGLFYLGMLELMGPDAVRWGLYLGLYTVISLILMMLRRVMPMFVKNGTDERAEVRNARWLDIASLVLFLLFMIAEVFWPQWIGGNLLAAALFVLHSLRLWYWHAVGIWRKPLLWVLYLGYVFIVLGFALKAASAWLAINPFLSVHAFAVGGIGVTTAGMMSRVSLGHTGRNVFAPPRILVPIFALLVLGALVRVLPPLLLPGLYAWWIGIALACWVAGFALFVAVYGPMFVRPRVDGRFG